MFDLIKNFHIGATLLGGLGAAAMLVAIRDPKTPKWMDVAASILLLVWAALFLGMVQSIFGLLPDSTAEERDLRNQYQVVLYLIPFFSAGLATNLLSNVILSQRDYTGTMSFHEAAKKTLWAIWFSCLVVSVVGLVLYVFIKKIKSPQGFSSLT
ncbi:MULTISPECIES: hypothetical protein [unclassified Pseudomonas]|uniref:hypothetical protein n=1 Tax=unclassified Pseudomonas TaxID=196821 RepID=UPI000F561CDF|nr:MULTISPECIES: hypothetical protein [unclassified Pseudomonas]